MELRAKYTFFAVGARGHLGKQLIAKYQLDQDTAPQSYGIGIKELWEIPANQHQEGLVVHTAGWPMDNATYGGSFIYHLDATRVYVGYVVGLDYQDPLFDPHAAFQHFKRHPFISGILEGGSIVRYGAKALPEGGWNTQPRLYFDGGVIVGDAANFVNSTRLKGIHLAMRSGMLADLVITTENPLSNLKTLYGTGHMRLNPQTNRQEKVGGVKYTIKDGIVYDAKQLLADIEKMGDAQRRAGK